MKYITIVFSLFLVSCGTFELSSESVLQSYNSETKTLHLEEKNISGFVYLNTYKPEEEIVDIMLQNNSIEVVDVTGYTDLELLNISNNKINYFWDIKLPEQILHLNASGNNLSTLDGIEKLKRLKTLDLRNNKLDSADLEKLGDLENLKVVLVDGNPDVSQELINDLRDFSLKYIATIKNPEILDSDKHSYLK